RLPEFFKGSRKPEEVNRFVPGLEMCFDSTRYTVPSGVGRNPQRKVLEGYDLHVKLHNELHIVSPGIPGMPAAVRDNYRSPVPAGPHAPTQVVSAAADKHLGLHKHVRQQEGTVVPAACVGCTNSAGNLVPWASPTLGIVCDNVLVNPNSYNFSTKFIGQNLLGDYFSPGGPGAAHPILGGLPCWRLTYPVQSSTADLKLAKLNAKATYGGLTDEKKISIDEGGINSDAAAWRDLTFKHRNADAATIVTGPWTWVQWKAAFLQQFLLANLSKQLNRQWLVASQHSLCTIDYHTELDKLRIKLNISDAMAIKKFRNSCNPALRGHQANYLVTAQMTSIIPTWETVKSAAHQIAAVHLEVKGKGRRAGAPAKSPSLSQPYQAGGRKGSRGGGNGSGGGRGRTRKPADTKAVEEEGTVFAALDDASCQWCLVNHACFYCQQPNAKHRVANCPQRPETSVNRTTPFSITPIEADSDEEGAEYNNTVRAIIPLTVGTVDLDPATFHIRCQFKNQTGLFLLDTGLTSSFIDQKFARSHGICSIALPKPIIYHQASSGTFRVTRSCQGSVTTSYGVYSSISFSIAPLSNHLDGLIGQDAFATYPDLLLGCLKVKHFFKIYNPGPHPPAKKTQIRKKKTVASVDSALTTLAIFSLDSDDDFWDEIVGCITEGIFEDHVVGGTAKEGGDKDFLDEHNNYEGLTGE
ncbi:hypothetical protein HK097_002833, partial [Rhizophlyctis rosea]